MQPEIDYVKIGQRIKAARQNKGYSQAELGSLVGCSNNHISHIEVGQTKVSLSMLLRLTFVLGKSIDHFVLDTPYAQHENIVDEEISEKLQKCNTTTLLTLNKIIDALLEQQKIIETTTDKY